MAKGDVEIPECLLCHEPAIDITCQDFVYRVQCIDCGTYDILELAAKHIQELPLEDRLKLLARARAIGNGQEGPPLIREPFEL
jgi:hypothetical protein